MNLSVKFKRVIQKLTFKDEIAIFDEKKLEAEAKKELEAIMSANTKITDCNINYIPDMHMKTAARENVIKRLCGLGEYSAEKCLIVMNPYGYVPLSAVSIFKTEKPLRSRMWVDAPGDTKIVGECPPAVNHRIPIIGLFPASSNYVTIELYDKENLVKRIRFVLEMGELPEDMRGMVKILKNSGEPASPFYYVSGVDSWFPYVFDRNGKIRYYITNPCKNYGVFPLSGGMLLHSDRYILKPSYGVPHSIAIHKMDAFGRIRQTMYVRNGLHHDTVEMAGSGNYLIATSSLENYCEDAVAEIDVKTGKTVKQINMDDIITEESVKDTADWAHMNTVSYNNDDCSVLVCLRNLHSVLKLDWKTKKLIWILGDPFFWKGTTMEKYVLSPVGDNIKWFYQAHSSFQLDKKHSDGRPVVKIAIYDNHWQSRRKTDNFDGDVNSYGLIYDINEQEKTVSLCKSFESKKSPVRSNVVYYPDKDRFDVMSGCLKERYENGRALIYDYKYSTGKLKNKYLIKDQFYRAYPFKFDFKSLAEPVDYDNEIFGELDRPVQIDKIDTDSAVFLDVVDREAESLENKRKKMKTRAEKEKEWQEMTKGKTWAELDHTGRIEQTGFRRCGDILFLWGIDHIVSRFYMVSDDAAYMMDYSQTEQEIPAIFVNYGYYMPVPLDTVKDGRYKLYVECFDTLYDTKKYIQIGE